MAVEAVKPPAKQDEATSAKLFLDSLQKTERARARYLAAIEENAPAKAKKALARAAIARDGVAADVSVRRADGGAGCVDSTTIPEERVPRGRSH